MSTAQAVEETVEWIPVEVAAVRAHLSLSTLYRKIREGVLPAFKQAGGKTVLRLSDVDEFMKPKPIAVKAARKKRKKR